MIRRITVFATLCALGFLPAFAQHKGPSKSYVLKAARMFDGKSNAIVTPGIVVVSDGKITGVGASANVPSDAQVIDLGDATLLPGFIDAHTHLTMVYSEDYAKAALDGLRKPIPEMALDASVNARITLTWATGGVLSLADAVDTPQLTQAELDALVDEAHACRLKTAAPAHGAEGAKRAIRAGIDSVEHGSFLDDEALDMMKQKGTYYVPTLMAVQGLSEQIQKGVPIPPAIKVKAEDAIAHVHLTFQKAIAKGIKIGLAPMPRFTR